MMVSFVTAPRFRDWEPARAPAPVPLTDAEPVRPIPISRSDLRISNKLGRCKTPILVIHRVPRIVRVQALADVSRSALYWRSNETCAPIANPPKNAQLEGTPYHSSNLHAGPCSSVGMRRGIDIV